MWVWPLPEHPQPELAEHRWGCRTSLEAAALGGIHSRTALPPVQGCGLHVIWALANGAIPQVTTRCLFPASGCYFAAALRSKALWPCSSISASGCLLEMPQIQGSSTLQLSDRSCSCDCSTYHCTPQLTEAPGW